MLLEVDGLDTPWDGMKIPSSEWDGELGNLDSSDLPLAMRRIFSPAEIRVYDTSSTGSLFRPRFQLPASTGQK